MRLQKHFPLLALAAAAVLLPLLPIPQFWITKGNYIGMYALVALGLVLLTGVGGITSFGQAAFVGIGAYTTAYLCTVYGMSQWITLLIGLLLTGVFAFLLGLLTLRMSSHYLPLATIAWGTSLYLLFEKVSWLGKYDGIGGIPALDLFGINFADERHMFQLIWLVLLVAVLLTLNLLDSRPGRAIRALKGGRVMAEAMGVDTGRYKIMIFVLAALMASTSGWLFAHLQRRVNPSPFGIHMGIEYLFMAVVGGTAHVWGAVVGAGILQVLEDQLQRLLPKLFGAGGNYEPIVFGVVLVLLLKYARGGLWPWLRTQAGRLLPRRVAQTVAQNTQPLERRIQPLAGQQILQVSQVSKRFGGLVAVNAISFGMKAGEIVGLIGPNGAGKSTTFNLVTGLLMPSSGNVKFLGDEIAGLNSRAISQRGIARTFQHVKLLPTMTVLENVALGAHQRGRGGI
ncbi:MAG: branched-chain amino acid transport system ATP-binding protein livM, partial [Burkholderiales bacterium]